MASQKQGRNTTGQQGSGRRGQSGDPANRNSQPGQSAGAASRGGRGQSGGGAGRGGRGQSGGAAGRGGRPGQPAQSGGSPNRGGRQGQPGGGQVKGREPGPPRAATLPRDSAFPVAPVRRPPAPGWLQLTTLILSLVGLGFSVYLTIAHFTSSSVLLCPANSFVNCGEVTTSPESIIFGIFPVAVLGLAFYVFMVAINSPWAWRSELPAIRWARLGGVITGIAFVLYLVYAELIEIGKLCEYCTAVHIITFVLFTLIVFDASFRSGTTGAAARR
jgi:uncharacterized membrane protein